MIVGTCGFGSTGSSAVSDYLKEYKTLQVIDKFEFSWVSATDGLIDLDFHVNHPHSRTSDSITAIERYKNLCKKKARVFANSGLEPEFFSDSVDKFISSIVTTSWKWNSPTKINLSFSERVIRKLLRETKLITKWEMKHGCQWGGYPYVDVYLSIMPPDFDIKAKNHVMEIVKALSDNSGRDIIMDQPFPGNNPQACFKFYDDPYAIVVDRDPRDNYTFAKTKLLSSHTNHLMPTNSVKDFVKYYRALRDNQPYKEIDPRILRLQFEDMVYNYEEATKKIQNFLHLSENPNPKSIFDPIISRPNTQVWKRYPKFADDIKYIEDNLTEYLYDYTDCPEPDTDGEMFFGKSPKNK